MTFLHPLILLGLLAAAIPLIIHLFHFRRPRKVDFSSLIFLRELQQRTMRRMRLQQWLVLLFRTLALVALVVGFAGPTLQRGSLPVGAHVPTSAVFLVDNSLSMTLRDAGGSYLEQARQAAETILKEFQPGDEVFVRTLVSTRDTEPFRDHDGARQALQAIKPRMGVEPLLPSLYESVRLLEGATHPQREVYVFSDLQASMLGKLQPAGETPGDVRIWLVPVGTLSHENRAIRDVRIESRIVEQGTPVRLTVDVENASDQAIRDYVVALYVNRERVAQTTVSMGPWQRGQVQLTFTPRERGWLRGRVVIEEDAFPADDTRYFVLHIPERRDVLLVEGQEPLSYLKAALSLRVHGAEEVFHLKTIDERSLADEPLTAYEAIVLAGVRDLSSGERARLRAYLDGGGGVILLPGARMTPQEYQKLFDTWQAGRVQGLVGTPGSALPVGRITQLDYEHPLFEGVFQELTALKEQRVEAPEVYAAWKYRPGSAQERTIARLSDGSPFLEEITVGRGKVLFFASFPDISWTDLPVRSLFVPLLYRSLYYVSAPQANGEVNGIVGEPLQVYLPAEADASRLKVITPSGDEIIPEQRVRPGQLQLILPVLHEAGWYEVRDRDTVVRLFAVNLQADESDLRLAAPEEVVKRIQDRLGVPVYLVDARGSTSPEVVEKRLVEARRGVSVWNVFILLALLFLITEAILTRIGQHTTQAHI